MTDSSLKETTINIFEELGASFNPSDIEACHCVGPYSRKKVSSRSPDGEMQRERVAVCKKSPYECETGVPKS